MNGDQFWVETKLDGERIQMHYRNGTFMWFSRSRKNYTDLYGANCNAGSSTVFIKDCLPENVERFIIINLVACL
jgi:DNA ligase 4